MTPKLSTLDQFIAARVKQRFAATLRTASMSEEELAALSVMDMLKPSYRGKQFEYLGLGEYKPDNEHIKSLIDKGFVKIVGGKNIQLDKAKAKAEMKKHPIPSKYKNKLENASMQFKRKDEE